MIASLPRRILALTAFLLGFVASVGGISSSSGCGACGACESGGPPQLEGMTLDVVEVEFDPDGAAIDWVEGEVTVGEDEVVLVYTLADGSVWRVTWPIIASDP